MSEFRQDVTTGAWVIVAPERGRRPQRRHGEYGMIEPVAEPDSACPFCPGNESMLPGITEEISRERPPGWAVRVVPNKYAAVQSEPGRAAPNGSAGRAETGYGYHEVVIETPAHDLDISRLSAPELKAVLQIYRGRHAELIARPGIQWVTIFRNHGGWAGASLSHPHSQVMGVGLRPPRLAAATAWARSYHGESGRCPTCDYLERELEDGKRVLDVTETFLVVAPFAATGPFEQWILPRRHQPSFADVEEGDLADFGSLLQRALLRLDAALENPPYNFAVDSALVENGEAPYVHWRLRIIPQLGRPGGFELASGVPINPSSPEDDAEVLRSATAAIEESSNEDRHLRS